ncbi:MAG: hypothetical protein QOJ01_275 [Solirubrobacterales bacterium]|nr:hypothetical protein [Solirubrobacterales bacterium]
MGEPSGRAIRDSDVRRLLLVAGLAGAALVLWFGRNTTFTPDEMALFQGTPHLDLNGALQAYNGHLILVNRLVYAAMFHAFGTDYLPFRVLGYATTLLTVGVLFVFMSRRVGALVALAPALVLLVYGSDSLHVLTGNTFGDLFPVATGIGALLALERDDLIGAVIACALLCAAVATFSVGLAFVVGAGVLVMSSPERRRRAWVFGVPLLLYVAWYLWSRGEATASASDFHASNLLLAPIWALDSLATACTSLTGLGYQPFAGSGDWGPLLAAAVVVALIWRLRHGPVDRWFVAMLAVPVTLWVLEAAVQLPPFREPDSARYVFSVTVCVLVAVAEGARGLRLGRTALAILFGAAVIGLSTNLFTLQRAGATARLDAIAQRSVLGALSIAGGRLGAGDPPEFLGVGNNGILWATLRPESGPGAVASGYAEAVAEIGNPGYTVSDLQREPSYIRDYVDQVLAGIYGLHAAPVKGRPRGCEPIAGPAVTTTTFPVPPGGAVVLARSGPADLRLKRFGDDFTVDAGSVPGGGAALAIPRDSAPEPWQASITAGGVSVCSLGLAQAGSTQG